LNSISLKKALAEGQVIIGTWIFEFNTPGIARLVASTGADFIVYDMEHSGFGIAEVRSLVAESRGLDMAALVRVPAAQYHLIAPVLDVGADGIIAPMIETKEDAARLVESSRYYPQGHRGAAFSIAHDDFLPGETSEKMKKANESVLCSAIIESVRGVENVEQILSVPGIDLVWVGYNDLSLSMGIPGHFADPEYVKAIAHIVTACKTRGVPLAMLVGDCQQGLERIRQGFRCLSYWGDIWLLQRALTEGIKTIRAGVPHVTAPREVS